MRKTSKKIYCAFCKIKRNFYDKKHITWTNVWLSLLCAIITMFFIWQVFEPRIIVFFIFYLTLAEMFVQIRWRLSVVCPHCGFDPVMYLKNPNMACKKVQEKLDFRKDKGDFLLAKNDPFKNLPKRKIQENTNTTGLSKLI